MNLTNRFFSKFINIGFVCAVALLLLLFYLSYNKTQSLSAVYDQVNETYLVRMKLKEVVAEQFSRLPALLPNLFSKKLLPQKK